MSQRSSGRRSTVMFMSQSIKHHQTTSDISSDEMWMERREEWESVKLEWNVKRFDIFADLLRISSLPSTDLFSLYVTDGIEFDAWNCWNFASSFSSSFGEEFQLLLPAAARMMGRCCWCDGKINFSVDRIIQYFFYKGWNWSSLAQKRRGWVGVKWDKHLVSKLIHWLDTLLWKFESSETFHMKTSNIFSSSQLVEAFEVCRHLEWVHYTPSNMTRW